MRSRPIFVLPTGENLSDFDFLPSKEEKAVEKERAKRRKQAARRLVNLANLQKLWEREEAAYLKRMDTLRQKHIAAILVQAERDRIWLAQMNAWEQEIERRRNFYLTEHAKEDKATHAAHLAKLAEILTDIRKDSVRAERKVLEKRGVVRGRKS